MDVLNYLSKLATGYHTKSLRISGIAVKYKFYGKPVPFDPITMLKELQFKSQDPKCHNVILHEPLKDIADSKLIIGGKLKPVIVADFTINDCQFKVVRAVTTQDKLRYSRYEFYADGKIMAVFQRTYDYGKSFDSLMLGFVQNPDSPTFEGTSIFKGFHNSGQWILGEVFGHTQLWLVFDPKKVEMVQQQILLASNVSSDQKHFQ
ncbi:hypothetical protein J2X69_000091 [Algoriphagus sp. 4150]|uniref:hypothetical protein n=1 Tax=Algoriphagus sp. 4150 TaxID=2817756 RepID=UPI00286514DF|nr:hypothetical protein [Algoriphagus sp. 4150]MDR7127763.1 hypothetical protein [Algoriphagus sp. 4150]